MLLLDMATFDTLSTPPSASLAAILSHPDAFAQHSILPSVITSEVQAKMQAIANDELSSSDKENSPPSSTSKLEQGQDISPPMKSPLQLSPARKQMSFTPQRVRPPPRAWERRPATPFIPRNEGQKIWKRIPLQELGVEVNQQLSRREKDEKENYVRVVKRLRLDLDAGVIGEDCDRVVATGTKWEEDNIEKDGSPKKKVRVEGYEQVPSARDVINRGKPTLGCPSLMEDKQVDYTTVDDSTLYQSTSLDTGNEQSIEPGPDGYAVDEACFGIIRATKETVECHKKTASGGIINGVDQWVIGNPEATTNIEGSGNENIFAALLTLPSDKDEFTSDMVPERGSVEAPAIVFQNSLRTSEHDQCHDSDDTIYDQEHTEAEVTMNSGLSAPAALTPNTTFPVTGQAITTFSSSDHEETAFLRQFLERAQASKAARITSSPQPKSKVSPNTIMEDDQLSAEMSQCDRINDVEDDDLSPPLETANIEQMFQVTDTKLSSPIRRSARTAARAAGSRLPRFQIPPVTHFGTVSSSQHGITTLPGNIQLKRATGHEFIFNAKPQQTLTIMTRSNTKRNQADAVHVAQRLAQLRKEEEVRLMEEQLAEAAGVDTTKPLFQTTVPQDEDAKRMNMKRKRNKQNEGKTFKARRTVTWPCDEQLAYYREPSPFVDASEANECSDEIVASPAASSDHALSKMTTEIAATTEPVPSIRSGHKSNTKDETEDLSKLKVRRIRKIKLDSVNGTPAPKTRSRCIADSDKAEESGITGITGFSTMSEVPPVFTPRTSTGTNTRNSSRMPVPVSTPIPLPALTTTKPKFGYSSTDKENSKPPASIRTPNKARADLLMKPEKKAPTTTTTTSAISNPDRKLDGRRRLRGREATQG